MVYGSKFSYQKYLTFTLFTGNNSLQQCRLCQPGWQTNQAKNWVSRLQTILTGIDNNKLFCRRYEIIEEVEEEKETSSSISTITDLSENIRPRSKTKRDKDIENKKRKVNLKNEKVVDSLLTDTDSNSSDWVTLSIETVDNSSNNVDNDDTNSPNDVETDNCKEPQAINDGSLIDIKSISDTYTIVSESDDNQVVVIPEVATETTIDEVPQKDTREA